MRKKEQLFPLMKKIQHKKVFCYLKQNNAVHNLCFLCSLIYVFFFSYFQKFQIGAGTL